MQSILLLQAFHAFAPVRVTFTLSDHTRLVERGVLDYIVRLAALGLDLLFLADYACKEKHITVRGIADLPQNSMPPLELKVKQRARRFAKHPKCVGIGECGLDFFKHSRTDPSEVERQLRAFRGQAQLAVELGKALVVHARMVTAENEELCFNTLSELVPVHHPIRMHCFGDSLEFAKALCARWPKLRIGFTGAITFRDKPKKDGKGKAKGKGGVVENKGEEHCAELIRGLPLERLLIETDGPYMCPEPAQFRGQTAHRRLEAWVRAQTEERLGQIHQVPMRLPMRRRRAIVRHRGPLRPDSPKRSCGCYSDLEPRRLEGGRRRE